MNARVSPDSLLVATCPAATLASQLAAADTEHRRLDALYWDDEARHVRFTTHCEMDEVFDLEERLAADAEYATPTSAQGATLLVVLMGRALRAALVPGDETEDDDPAKSVRRYNRLQARLLEYLAAQSGATIEELGLSGFHLSNFTVPEDRPALPPEPHGVVRASVRA